MPTERTAKRPQRAKGVAKRAAKRPKARARARAAPEKPVAKVGISVPVRFPNSTIDRIDELAKRMERPGISISRSGMMRAALLKGLAKLDANKMGNERHGGAPNGSADQLQTAVRLSHEVIERIDGFAERISQPGLPVSRSEALRRAIIRGLEALEAEQRRK